MQLHRTFITALCTIFLLTACGGGGGGSGGQSNAGGNNGGGSSGDGAVVEEAPPLDPNSVLPELKTTLNYNDLSVHDPSIVQSEDGTFYVIGSHLAMSKSSDLVSWQSVADGVDDSNPLFNTYATEVAEGVNFVGGWAGSWAGDIIQLPDQRWYFYYDHCATAAAGLCDFPRSYLGVAVADDIEGPYTNLGIFLWSGQTDEELANGDYRVGDLTHYDPTIHPNAIDPDAFFDKDGQMWLVYGSYSGGIFILRMDAATGLPEPDQGYGTHLAGGDHSAIEGPYIFYSPQTDYYYLFTSFGGFGADDGYNIRVSRSRNPQGPYLDAELNDMVLARGDWDSISPYGVKLMGGFSFAAIDGGGASWGYQSPGHNSAFYDADNEQHVLIFHTRFPSRGEIHAIRVHELLVTSDDWLVASPQRYAPTIGSNFVAAGDLYGDYQYINHGKDIDSAAKPSIDISLMEDGTIQGEASGSFLRVDEDSDQLALTIEGEQFACVVQWQWSIRQQEFVPVITGLATSGQSIWLSKL